MNGIDISRWNPINLSKVSCDFVIVKATQGTSYVSPRYKEQITQADKLGKLLGVYHYASSGGAIAEAEHFLQTVDAYIGKAILVLDWEGDQNVNFKNPSYAMAWLKYVKDKTGITPFIYMSKSVCRQYAWDSSYPLWCAQYKNQQPSTYQKEPWTDKKGFGAWDKPLIYQYTSKGQLDGYSGNLDLDIAYMNEKEWHSYASGETVSEPIPTEPMNYPTLKKGSQNEYVRAWQTFLNLNGYDCGMNDGIFGSKTEKAVKAWQKAHPECGKADGIIGPKTWATLPII